MACVQFDTILQILKSFKSRAFIMWWCQIGSNVVYLLFAW